eukprot:scaffold170202_cov32-Tisochrysis_lutea.AAC.3
MQPAKRISQRQHSRCHIPEIHKEYLIVHVFKLPPMHPEKLRAQHHTLLAPRSEIRNFGPSHQASSQGAQCRAITCPSSVGGSCLSNIHGAC